MTDRPYLKGRDLDGRSAGGGREPRRDGALGLGLGLHLGQSLLVKHQQLPTLASHQNHAWGSQQKEFHLSNRGPNNLIEI